MTIGMTGSLPSWFSRRGLALVLKQVTRSGTVPVTLGQRPRQSEEHKLGGFVDSRAKLNRQIPQVRHLKCDGTLETWVDFRRGQVCCEPDSCGAASALDEACEVSWDVHLFKGLRQYELTRLECVRVPLGMLPEILRFPDRRV